MVLKYTPKIKVSTAKSVAKNLLTTQAGKKISDTKFKKFLQKDTDLKRYSYLSKNSSLKSYEAKKFFGKVAGSAKTSGQLKISQVAAKKLGFRINSQGEVSDIGLKKIYQKAGAEEMAAGATKNAEPSPEEQRRQKRHDLAVNSFRRFERAKAIQSDQAKPAEQAGQQPKPFTPVARSGAIAGSASQAKTTPADKTAPPTKLSKAEPRQNVTLAVLPLHIVSASAENLDVVAQKLYDLISRTMASLGAFSVVSRYKVEQGLTGAPPPLAELDDLVLIGRHIPAQLIIAGEIKKTGRNLSITIQLINRDNGKRLTLASIQDSTNDIFDLERKIAWQITNALAGEEKEDDKPPHTDKIVELPI